MSDLRMIRLTADKNVELDAGHMDVPLNPLEEAIQRIVVCLLTTPASMVDAVGWGGGGSRLFLSVRKANPEDTRQLLVQIIQATMESLRISEPATPYRVIDLQMLDFARTDRGLSVVVRVIFEEATSIDIGLLNVSV